MELLTEGEEIRLMQVRPAAYYSDAERRFSSFVQWKLRRLLKGQDNDFLLMRRACLWPSSWEG